MLDRFGREITYLRISVTEKCNLNCSYCGNSTSGTREMTADEIADAAELFAETGIRKIRLTGGEPLIRKDIVEIVKKLSSIRGITKTAITTNGVLLEGLAPDLKNAGISAINISLDSLNDKKYCKITGVDALSKVLKGITAASQAGIPEIKINCVPVKGQNEDEIGDLISLAEHLSVDVRFIELMPFSEGEDNRDKIITGTDILERFPCLKPTDTPTDSVAQYYKGDNFKGKVGLITPVSNKFCNNCNRIRLLSDGRIRPCLGSDISFSLAGHFGNKDEMRRIIREAIEEKPEGHNFYKGFESPHGLNRIGG